MVAPNKTHREVKNPEISARYLADYMAASEQARRGILQRCKYQAIVRVVQHTEAQAIITNYLKEVNPDKKKHLTDKADHIRNKLADSDFEGDVNEHNADYVDRFSKVCDGIDLPDAERMPAPKFAPMVIGGTKFKFRPNLILQRTTKTNKIRVGAIMLRYAKGKPLSEEIGCWQSAAAFGYLAEHYANEEMTPEQKLCLTVDGQTGIAHPAPTNSVYRFKEISAACATIAEQWSQVKAPKGAVL